MSQALLVKPTASATAELRALDEAWERLQAVPGHGLAGMARAEVAKARWEEALLAPVRSILERQGKRFRARLVEAGYRLAGGGEPAPEALTAAIEIIHAGSLIIDDIEDESSERRGGPAVHRLFGVPRALNAGNWMYFLPFELVSGLGLPAPIELDLLRRMQHAMLDCHRGQALDLTTHVAAVDQGELPGLVAATTALKTGALTELAMVSGAIAAGAGGEVAAAVARFGARLGCGLQMLDDIGNLKSHHDPAKRCEDLRHGRPTWVWAWVAETVEGRRFAGLQERARSLRTTETKEAMDALATELLEAMGVHRRGQVRLMLRQGLAELQKVVGPSPVMTMLAETVVRLEESYG